MMVENIINDKIQNKISAGVGENQINSLRLNINQI